MATRPYRAVAAALLLGLTLWVWALVGALFALRWNSIERPNPPLRALFPYGEMRIGVDASYPPFAAAGNDGLYGLDIDLGTILAAQLGAPVRFVNMGYDGLYDSLKADQVDVLISALLIDYSRTDEVFYSIPYYNAGLTLVVPSDSPIHGMSDLSGLSLAYEFGSDADLQARQWLRRITPFTLRPYELPTLALDAARIGDSSAALVDATSARLYLRQHQDWNTSLIPTSDALYALAVRTDHGLTLEALNRELEKLLGDGTVAALIAKWL